MIWQVVMGEDGAIVLPPELIHKLGWTPETPLRWINKPDHVLLKAVRTKAGTETK